MRLLRVCIRIQRKTQSSGGERGTILELTSLKLPLPNYTTHNEDSKLTSYQKIYCAGGVLLGG